MVKVFDFITKEVLIDYREGDVFITLFPIDLVEIGDASVYFIDDLLSQNDLEKIESFVHRIDQILEKMYEIELSGHVIPVQLLGLSVTEDREKLIKTLKLFVAIKKACSRSQSHEIKGEICDQHYQWVLDIFREDVEKESKRIVQAKGFSYHLKNFVADCWSLLGMMKRTKNRKTILWLGGKNINSYAFKELGKRYNFCVLEENRSTRLDLTKNRIAFKTIKAISLSHNEAAAVKKLMASVMEELANICNKNGIPLGLVQRCHQLEYDTILYALTILKGVILHKDGIDVMYCEQSIKHVNYLLTGLSGYLGIKSVEFVHGVPASAEVGRTTVVGVYGQRDIDFYNKEKITLENIHIVGSPRFDVYNELKRTSSDSFGVGPFIFGLDPIRYKSVQNSEYENHIMLEALLAAVKDLDTPLVIKMHPRQKQVELKYFEHLIKLRGMESKVRVVHKTDLSSLLLSSRGMITHNSTVGVEALLLSVPLVVLDLVPHRTIHYEKFGAAEVVKNTDDLKACLGNDEIFSHEYFLQKQSEIDKTCSYFCLTDKTEITNRVLALFESLTY